jgi:hypothetical protein
MKNPDQILRYARGLLFKARSGLCVKKAVEDLATTLIVETEDIKFIGSLCNVFPGDEKSDAAVLEDIVKYLGGAEALDLGEFEVQKKSVTSEETRALRPRIFLKDTDASKEEVPLAVATGKEYFVDYCDDQGRVLRREDYDKLGNMVRIGTCEYYIEDGKRMLCQKFYSVALDFTRETDALTGEGAEFSPSGELIRRLRG